MCHPRGAPEGIVTVPVYPPFAFDFAENTRTGVEYSQIPSSASGATPRLTNLNSIPPSRKTRPSLSTRNGVVLPSVASSWKLVGPTMMTTVPSPTRISTFVATPSMKPRDPVRPVPSKMFGSSGTSEAADATGVVVVVDVVVVSVAGAAATVIAEVDRMTVVPV